MASENIQVVVRCRPFNEREKAGGYKKVVEIDENVGSVRIFGPKGDEDVKSFQFDAAFDEGCRQVAVYDKTARKIVDAVLQGFNGTVFAYGQTGTGKTFSMQGISHDVELRGIIPNAFHHIFDHIARDVHKKYLVRVSFLEIYNEDIRDLLVKPQRGKQSGLELKENPDSGVYVKDLQAFVVKSVEEMEKYMDAGNNARSVGATLMNENSSRSHSIFTITVESSETVDGEEKIVAGKLNLVDLAGSERQSKTGATGDRLKEATKINLSLSALGNCISALVDGKSSHIPYRDSKLTRLLQDSLGGNAKTLMLATMSPAAFNYDETMSSLRYANRAKNIKNKPKINEDPKDAMLREYQEEIKKLKEQLERRMKGEMGLQSGDPQIVKKIVKKVVKKVVKKKKKNKVDAKGQIIPGQAEEDEDEEVVVEEEEETDPSLIPNPLASLDQETISRLQAEVEAEKKALLQSKDMVVEEKQKIAAQLEQRAQELENERQVREQMAQQLQAMQAKLLMGGVNIFDHVKAQERELQETQVMLQEQARIEKELQGQIEAKQELQMQKEENYASLQEEVDIKSKKLKKLWSKLQAAKSEVSELQDEFRHEKEDLLDTMRELTREMSLRMVIIDNFIPPQDRIKVEKRMFYNEEAEEWDLTPVDEKTYDKIARPVSVANLRRPVCQFGKTVMMLGEGDVRYRGENIVNIKLDLPERTTVQPEQYDQPSVHYEEEEEIRETRRTAAARESREGSYDPRPPSRIAR